QKFRSGVWQFLDDPFSSYPAKIFGVWTTLLVALSIVTMCIETMPEFKRNITEADIAKIAGITLEDLFENYTWNSHMHQSHVDISVKHIPVNCTSSNEDTMVDTEVDKSYPNVTHLNNVSPNTTGEPDVKDTHTLNDTDHNYRNDTNSPNTTEEPDVKNTHLMSLNITEENRGNQIDVSNKGSTEHTDRQNINATESINVELCNKTDTMGNTSQKMKKAINIQKSLSATNPALATIDMVLNIYFILELLIRFAVSPNKYKFVFTFYTLSDILAIAPVWIQYVVNMYDEENRYKFTLIDVSNCLLIMRVFRAFRLLKHLVAYQVIIYTLKASIKEIILMLLLLILGMLIFATLIYFSEAITHEPKNLDITSIPIACWYALVTMTTVG
ncbi:unnamed protein product, partial [Owenia fusiformis]